MSEKNRTLELKEALEIISSINIYKRRKISSSWDRDCDFIEEYLWKHIADFLMFYLAHSYMINNILKLHIVPPNLLKILFILKL